MSAHKYIYIYYGFCTYYISHLGLFFVCSVCVFFSLLLVLIVLGVVQRFFFPTVVLLSYTRVFLFFFLFDVQTKKIYVCVCVCVCVGSFSFFFFCVYYYYHHHSHLYKIIIPTSISSVCVDVY